MLTDAGEFVIKEKEKLKDLELKYGSLQSSYEELKTSHENLKETHEKIKKTHNTLLDDRVTPSTSISNDQAQPIVQDSSNDDYQIQDQVGSTISSSTSTQEPIVSQRIHHVLAKDHPVDQIMGDISKGVQTRSRIASFCEHYSFVSFLEPNRIDEALRVPDWVNAMHEELNNFTRNQVWDLVERQKNYNVICTKWVFRNKQNEDGMVVRKRQDWWLKASLKSKVWISVKLLLPLID